MTSRVGAGETSTLPVVLKFKGERIPVELHKSAWDAEV
jgi:hypothetical protein